MSRPVIAAVSAALIAALTAVAYLVTTSSLEGRIRSDVKNRVSKGQDLLLRNAELEGLGLLKRAEALASDPRFVLSLSAEGKPNGRVAEDAFQVFRQTLAVGEPKPDILSLTDKDGKLVALLSKDKPVSNPIPETYLVDNKIEYPALALALSEQHRIADVWAYEDLGPMKVATVPILDPDQGGKVLGALIVAYGISSAEATREKRLLGAEIAYFYAGKVHATSFAKGRVEVSGNQLNKSLFEEGMAAEALTSKRGIAKLISLDIDGEEYIATAGRLPTFRSKDLPSDYPAPMAGALVGMSVDAALAPLAPVKLALLLVGFGSIIVALLAMFLAVKRILGPIDRIEVGVAEMLNGNLDYVFEPVGSDLDGLANGLNVLLARLLGRPEPGDEEYDDEGNLVRSSSSMQFTTESLSPKDAEALRLAQEPEDQYYTRLHKEFKSALEAAGDSTSGLTLESFINKLRLSEATLKEKYESRGVRFKVVTEGSKVTLKPVPIM